MKFNGTWWHTRVILCTRTCTSPRACICWDLCPPPDYMDIGSKEHCPWPRKKRATKMTATLHILWGLSPYMSLYIHKAFSLLLQSSYCFSQLLRKFHSCLSPLLHVCPFALGISTSWQQRLWCSPVFLQLLTSLCCHSQILLLLHNPLQVDRKASLCQASCFPQVQEEGASTRSWGESTFPSSCLYPNTVPNPN